MKKVKKKVTPMLKTNYDITISDKFVEPLFSHFVNGSVPLVFDQSSLISIKYAHSTLEPVTVSTEWAHNLMSNVTNQTGNYHFNGGKGTLPFTTCHVYPEKGLSEDERKAWLGVMEPFLKTTIYYQESEMYPGTYYMWQNRFYEYKNLLKHVQMNRPVEKLHPVLPKYHSAHRATMKMCIITNVSRDGKTLFPGHLFQHVNMNRHTYKRFESRKRDNRLFINAAEEKELFYAEKPKYGYYGRPEPLVAPSQEEMSQLMRANPGWLFIKNGEMVTGQFDMMENLPLEFVPTQYVHYAPSRNTIYGKPYPIPASNHNVYTTINHMLLVKKWWDKCKPEHMEDTLYQDLDVSTSFKLPENAPITLSQHECITKKISELCDEYITFQEVRV